MSYQPPIQKARSRYGWPGRQSQAIAMAVQASMFGAQQDSAAVIPGQGIERHEARMAAMDPVLLKKRAKVLGYEAMDLSASVIPSQAPAIVAPLATVAPVGVVVMATTAPKAPKAVLASVVADAVPAVVLPAGAGADFCDFLMEWSKSKTHSRGISVYQYLRKSFETGKKWNPATKRWVK